MPEQSDRPYKLLVVDDEADVMPMFRQSMRQDVRRGRYRLFFATSGVEALECLENEPGIDLVVTDLNMPDMDGLALLEELAGSQFDLRSVVLSAYGDMKNIRAAMALGAVDFVVKPVDFDDMHETIERTLRNLEQWREVVAQRDQLVSLRSELEIAGRIQQSVLPVEFPPVEGFDVHAVLDPAREVGGDFYDVMRLDGGRVGFVVADVCGKGVPAAMVMMSARTLVRGAAIGLGDPASVLSEVNAIMAENNPLAMFVTAFFCVLDPRSGHVVYANAGHPPPLLVRADGTAAFLETAGVPAVGILPDQRYGLGECALEPGDLLFMYSDGVTEAENGGGEQFGEGRLRRLLSENPSRPAGQVAGALLDALRDFAVQEVKTDDVTCVLLRRESR